MSSNNDILYGLLKRFDASRASTDCRLLLNQIAHIATPAEIFQLAHMELGSCRDSMQSRVLKTWLKDPLFKAIHSVHFADLEKFKLRDLGGGVFKYHNPEIPENSKALIVAVRGGGDALMAPMCSILNTIPSDAFDVITLPVKALRQSSFQEFLESVRAVLQLNKEHARLIFFGTSFGALPALIAANVFRSQRVLAVGTGSPYALWWRDVTSFDPFIYLQSHAQAWNPRTMLVYGYDAYTDKVNANEISQILVSAESHAVTDPKGGRVGHSCLVSAARRGLLGDLFRHAFGF